MWLEMREGESGEVRERWKEALQRKEKRKSEKARTQKTAKARDRESERLGLKRKMCERKRDNTEVRKRVLT